VTITVVGAGVVGCAVAYELAARGAAVQVVDARGIGLGATLASAGMLAPRIEGHSAALLRLAQCGLAIYDQFVARVRGDAAQRFEYERTGTLQIARDAPEFDALAKTAAELAAADVPCTLFVNDTLTALEPSLTKDVRGGLLIPEHGYIAVAPFLQALVEACRRRSVVFRTSVVNEVTHDGTRACVVASDERIESDVVIVAAGSWSSSLSAAAVTPAPVRPIKGQLVRLRASNRAASRVLWSSRCYLVPWEDGSTLVGATVEDAGFDESATAGAVHALLDAAIDLVPSLASSRFDEVRVGLRPLTADELPAIGRSSTMPDVIYATGHYRNGVLLAPLTASLVADLVLEGRARPELAVTAPDRLGL
jgi:glycine oxidase